MDDDADNGDVIGLAMATQKIQETHLSIRRFQRTVSVLPKMENGHFLRNGLPREPVSVRIAKGDIPDILASHPLGQRLQRPRLSMLLLSVSLDRLQQSLERRPPRRLGKLVRC